MQKIQTFENKSGEVNFRKKLKKQHTSHEIVVPGEPNFIEKLQELRGRIERTEKVFSELRNRSIKLSPFLEIAAGEGYRSDLLASRFNQIGFATDISHHTLTSDQIITKKLYLKKRSYKICCDANNLPFLSNSFSFVFIALSLHHFPDPAPIINEAIRVLGTNGYFYFDEEPIKQGLNLNLWRRDFHLRWYEKILKYMIILIFLSRIGKAEVDHGILEETFSLKTWENALSRFESVEVQQSVFPFPWSTTVKKSSVHGWIKPSFLTRLGLFLFGGGIKGLGQVHKNIPERKISNIFKLLGCPNCRKRNTLKPLQFKKTHFYCPSCKTSYFKRKDVWMLLEKKLQKKLYGADN